MKHILSILSLFALILVLPSCKEQSKSDAPAESTEAPAAAPTPAPAADPAITVPPPAPTTPEPAQNAKGVWHYTCPKGCEGGAGAQGNCAKCGTALAHNAAYHQQ
ncbi:MAG: hypothetical protein IPM34_01160 [Saprospiraceae bacterium]|nr:hypothetical protein [Saprospiraceae bacterium]